jgi:hypothetical protein
MREVWLIILILIPIAVAAGLVLGLVWLAGPSW